MSALTLEKAERMIDAALAERRRMQAKPVAVAVIDDGGHLKAMKREDGASMFRPDVALGKAWGAVAMGEGSRGLARKARENPAFLGALSGAAKGRLLPNPGGVLIRDADGTILGAVGISGDSGPNDERLAMVGIEAAGFAADPGKD